MRPPRRSLRIPAVLAVVVLGGCTSGVKSPVDARVADGKPAPDAPSDAPLG